jgi:hypothetical protein
MHPSFDLVTLSNIRLVYQVYHFNVRPKPMRKHRPAACCDGSS